jgi:hypothetical protein
MFFIGDIRKEVLQKDGLGKRKIIIHTNLGNYMMKKGN